MWLLEFLYLMTTFFIAWTLFGYYIFVWFVGLFRQSPVPAFPDEWPMMSVVVLCCNEQTKILTKLENLRRLDYPRDRLEVIFADGCSDDSTVALLSAHIEPDGVFRVVNCPQRGRTVQVNHVLPYLKGDIIVNTDVDALLAPDALKWMAAEFASDPGTWVVGAYCRPGDALEIERYYWDAQNKGRLMETAARTSSIVIGGCYGFRRPLLSSFPEESLADDAYVAFFASRRRLRTVYSRYVTAIETRNPSSYAEFLPHKFRKSNAFLRESLRFLYWLPEMEPFGKTMLMTHMGQQLLLPWALLFWIVIANVLLTLSRIDVVLYGVAALIVLFAMTNRVFAWVKLPDGLRRYSLLTMVKGYLVMNLIMLVTGLSYLFFKQGPDPYRIADVPDSPHATHPSGIREVA